MMAEVTSALTQFHADLNRATHLLNLIKEFRRFGGSVIPDEVADERTPWPEALSLESSARTVRTDLPVLAGSLLLYVCGRFEHFVREVIVALADDLSSNAVTFEDLPESVRDALFDLTLTVAQNPRRFGYQSIDAQQMVIALAANINKEENATAIRSELLAVTEANMNNRILAEVMKRVGVNDIWQEIGKQAPLKAHLNVSKDGACRAEATSRLDEIMRDRNNLAHPTSSTSFPDPDQVLEVCEFFAVLCRVLVDVVSVPRVTGS